MLVQSQRTKRVALDQSSLNQVNSIKVVGRTIKEMGLALACFQAEHCTVVIGKMIFQLVKEFCTVANVSSSKVGLTKDLFQLAG